MIPICLYLKMNYDVNPNSQKQLVINLLSILMTYETFYDNHALSRNRFQISNIYPGTKKETNLKT